MALVSHYGNTMFPEDLSGFFGVGRCAEVFPRFFFFCSFFLFSLF
jgi:hypothetical protein